MLKQKTDDITEILLKLKDQVTKQNQKEEQKIINQQTSENKF